MPATAPLDVLADIPDEFLVPMPTRLEAKEQHALLERLVLRFGFRPSYLDLHNERVRRGLAAPLSTARRTPPTTNGRSPQ